MFTFIIIVIILVFVFGGSGGSSSSNQSTPSPAQRSSSSNQNATSSTANKANRRLQSNADEFVLSETIRLRDGMNYTVTEVQVNEDQLTKKLILTRIGDGKKTVMSMPSKANFNKINNVYVDKFVALSTKSTSSIKTEAADKKNKENEKVASSVSKETMRLSGVTYEGRQGIIAKMRTSDKIQMRRDKYNKYDKNAIGVYNSQNQNIGWIPRDKAAILAPSMDSGIEYHAKINKILGGNGYNFGLEILVSNDEIKASSNKPDNYKSKIIQSISENKYSGAYKSVSNWEEEDNYSVASYNHDDDYDDYNEYRDDYNEDNYGESEAAIREHQWEYNQNH